MDKESFFISQFYSKKIGDDGAVIGKYVYCVDAFCEDVHFKRSWMSLFDIARKSLLVNVSDALAMNAKPLFALLSIAIPKEFGKQELKELADGFLDVAKKYNIDIIGGDTISNKKLDISITLIAETKKPLMRHGINLGDLMAFSGDIGKVKKDLTHILRGGKLSKKSKFINLNLKHSFIQKAGGVFTSGLDISDGLFFELGRVSKINKIGFKFFKKFNKRVGCSGEEYELLFSFKPKDRVKILQLAKKSRTKITIFAKAIRGKFRNNCKPHHF